MADGRTYTGARGGSDMERKETSSVKHHHRRRKPNYEKIIETSLHGRVEISVPDQIEKRNLRLRLSNPNKKYIFQLCCPEGESQLDGVMSFSRWMLFKPSHTYSFKWNDKIPDFVDSEDTFSYGESKDGEVDFYINFADKNLFGYYGGPLFAQDEMQVAEHPNLAILREYLLKIRDHKIAAECKDYNGEPTPCIVMGAKRLCSIETDPNEEEGRPDGLYGNNFAYASKYALDSATTVLDKPTTTNIVAMVAPAYGRGYYSLSEINEILDTAFTTFMAAKIVAYIKAGYLGRHGETIGGTKPKIVIHTGNWGTGAFGGNKVMMALLQMVAARMASIDRLEYHTFSEEGTQCYKLAERAMNKLLPGPHATEMVKEKHLGIAKMLHGIEGMGLKWGVSNGT